MCTFKLFLIYLLHLFFKGKFITKAIIWKIASRSSAMKFCAFQDWGAYDIVYAWWKSSDRHLEVLANKSVTWVALHWTGKFHLWMRRLDAIAKRKSCCKTSLPNCNGSSIKRKTAGLFSVLENIDSLNNRSSWSGILRIVVLLFYFRDLWLHMLDSILAHFKFFI